ncbi:EthD family reductase [Embleya sp. NPDC059259]|uniref:EthD family reductase n=1 Tax=unclassified Embleya TaxID=2699296 RepID=UPI00368AB37A
MHELVVLYSTPADPDHFRDHYVTNHFLLVMNMPGLLAWRYCFDVAAAKGEAPYFAVFEGDFADAAAMAAARVSPQGRRVAADVADHVTGGAVVIHHPVRDCTGRGRTVRSGMPSVGRCGRGRPSAERRSWLPIR